jgi:hypothetical protein
VTAERFKMLTVEDIENQQRNILKRKLQATSDHIHYHLGDSLINSWIRPYATNSTDPIDPVDLIYAVVPRLLEYMEQLKEFIKREGRCEPPSLRPW